MNKRRMEEIALILLRSLARRKGLHVSPDIRREIGNISKDTGVSKEELLEFGKILTFELVEQSFNTRDQGGA